MKNQTNLHQILVVGGGAGGAELAKKLGHKFGKRNLAEVTLIDAKMTHIWKPLLHEVAAGTLDSSIEAMQYMDHAHRHYYKFQLGYMDQVDREQKEV